MVHQAIREDHAGRSVFELEEPWYKLCEIRLLGAYKKKGMLLAGGKNTSAGMGKRPRATAPVRPGPLAPQPAVYRNPQSVSEIRNPYQKSVSYFFLQGGYRAFFVAGFIRNP